MTLLSWAAILGILGVAAAAIPAVRPVSRSVAVRTVQGSTVRPLADSGLAATVLIFVAHDCPISNAYAPEIKRLRRDYALSRFGFYVVYVDRPVSGLAAHAAAHGYSAFALLDPSHKLVKMTGARVTPEAVVLGPSDHILYEGRIDDRFTGLGRERDVATVSDLRRALDAVRSGKTIAVARTKAVGCDIPGT